MKHVLGAIESVSEWSGKFVSIWVLVMIGVLCFEVILRYAFNAPTYWAHELSQHVYGAYSILAGAYVLLHHQHVKVDVIYGRLPVRARAILDLVTYLIFFLYIGVMLGHGFEMARHSWEVKEFSTTAWHLIMYPLKTTLALGAFMILLQGLAHFTRAFNIAIRGKELA